MTDPAACSLRGLGSPDAEAADQPLQPPGGFGDYRFDPDEAAISIEDTLGDER